VYLPIALGGIHNHFPVDEAEQLSSIVRNRSRFLSRIDLHDLGLECLAIGPEAEVAHLAWLGPKPRTVQRKLYNRQRINEELADSRARSRQGFAFLYAVATPVERQWLLEHSEYEQCQPENAAFSVRALDGVAYLRAREA